MEKRRKNRIILKHRYRDSRFRRKKTGSSHRTKQGSDITRVLYFFIVGKKAVLTNGFIKKSQKTPKAEKELAKKYKADYERNKKSQPEYSEKTCTGIRDAIKAGICSDANQK